MRNSKYKHIFIATSTFILLLAVALWSFNTVSELFGGPTAQYKHAIAGIGLLLILKWGLFPKFGNRISHRHGPQHFRSPPENVHEQ